MSKLIYAAFATAVSSADEEIVFLPEGKHDITATVNGKPGTVTVNVPPENGPQIAARLQAALADRHTKNVRPWFDFEHKRGAASAIPKSLRYEKGKGIMCSLEWSGSGKAAIDGKDFSYFSPEFYLGDDGTPDGLPERGPLGGLVNEPAFREIPRIAASDAAHHETTPPVMSKLIFAALAISAAAENAETEAVKAIDKLKTDHQTVSAKNTELQTENDTLKKKVDAAEAEATKTRKDRAETLVKAALADGRIAPKDEDTAKKFRDKIEAGDTFAEEILAGMAKKNENLDKAIVKAGEVVVQAGEHVFETKAKQLVAAKQAPDIDTAMEIVAASEPALYGEYLKGALVAG